MYYQVQKSACMPLSAEPILRIKKWGIRAHLDPHTARKWGGQDPRTLWGSPPLSTWSLKITRNVLLSVQVCEFWKPVNILLSYEKNVTAYFSGLCLVCCPVSQTGCVFKLFIFTTRSLMAFYYISGYLSYKVKFLNARSQFLHRKRRCASFTRNGDSAGRRHYQQPIEVDLRSK